MTLPSLERTVTHSTFVIERNYSKPVERAFAAFADPSRKRRWFAGERGMQVEEFEMEFRVGGRDHARFRFQEGSPFPGEIMGNDTVYQDIVPDRRIVIAYTMSIGGRRISCSLATFEFLPAGQGTHLIFTEQGAYFEGADGPQMRQEGWNKLLGYLDQQLARHSPAHA